MHNIAHDIRHILIFDISIQFKLCRYCITCLMYHNMAIYRYIVASLIPIDAIMLRLLVATNVLMHETIRTMNMCHLSGQISLAWPDRCWKMYDDWVIS